MMQKRTPTALYMAWEYNGEWIRLRDGFLKVKGQSIYYGNVTQVYVRGWPSAKLTICCVGQIIDLPGMPRKSALEIKKALGF